MDQRVLKQLIRAGVVEPEPVKDALELRIEAMEKEAPPKVKRAEPKQETEVSELVLENMARSERDLQNQLAQLRVDPDAAKKIQPAVSSGQVVGGDPVQEESRIRYWADALMGGVEPSKVPAQYLSKARAFLADRGIER